MKNVLAPIAIVAALAGCKKAENDTAAEARIPVKVAIAQMQPISETIGAIGSVAARPGFVASLTAPAQARVIRVAVSQGQPVVSARSAPVRSCSRRQVCSTGGRRPRTGRAPASWPAAIQACTSKRIASGCEMAACTRRRA